MAVSDRFNQALRKLQTMFGLHHHAPRSPDTVRELASRRANLDDARNEMAAQRELEGLEPFAERRSPKWVDPGWRKPATAFELIAVVVSVVIILGAFLWLLWQASAIGGEDHAVGLMDGSVVETLEPTDSGSCVWTVAFVLEAKTPASLRVQAIRINRSESSRTMTPLSTIPTGPLNDHAVGRLVYEFFTCPESIDDIDHGSLQVTYEVDRIRRTAVFGF